MSAAPDWVAKALAAKRESRTVEFKSAFDPSSKQDLCEVIKDIIAIANSGGGVILFGADNKGNPVGAEVQPILDLDHAKLCDQLRTYTGVDFDGCAIHEAKKGKHKLAALVIASAPTPIVFTHPGTYPVDGGKQGSAFSKGQIVFRHGAKSEPGTTADIRDAIDRRFLQLRHELLKGVKKVVDAPAGSRVNVLPPGVFDSKAADATPIRVTTDPKAPAYRVVDYDKSHPHRQKEATIELRKRLGPGPNFSSYDIYAIRELFDVKSNESFFHQPRYGSPQYSDAFLDWIADEYRKDNKFFEKVRLQLYERRQQKN